MARTRKAIRSKLFKRKLQIELERFKRKLDRELFEKFVKEYGMPEEEARAAVYDGILWG